MATIDKAKGQAVEEHSLSSFDKKRGKVAAYSAQKHKKYRVVSVQKMERADIHGHIGKNPKKSESTPQTPKRSETMRKMLYGTNRNNHSNRDRKNEGKTSENTEHSGIFANSENSVSVSKTITPEIAERMKRAAYLDRLNKDKIKTFATRSDISPDIDVSDNAENHSHDKMSVPHSEYEKKYLSETADSVIPEAKKAITPEMAERMRRAAFIEQKNAEAIRLNRATVVAETEDVPLEHLEQTEKNIADVPVEHLEETEEKSPTSTYLGNSDKAVFDTYNGEVRAYRAKKAYGEFAKKQKGSIVPNVGGSAVSAETQKAISNVQNVSQTLQSSDSAGSAVLDVSVTLAAVEAKKMVKKLAETDLKKKKRVDERMENHGNRFGIGSNHKDKVEKDKDEKIKNTNDKSCRSNEADGEKQGSSKVGNSHKLREEKQEYAKEQKSKKIRNRRKDIFFKENKKIEGSIVNTAVKGGAVKGALKKKAVSLILGGGAGAIVLPVFLAVLVYILISAFFGWLSPFSYSLAGEDNDPNTGLPTEHNAESKAEIIDGYTLMVKNYLDVAQAYYYLNYGDWYGGVYVYESAGLDFGTFFADYCQDLIAEIQAQYQPLIDQAPNPQAAMAISNAMGEAIRQALANAREAALAEYTELIQSLEDELSPSEHRQHYEVEVGYSSNGVDDATEFSGKPVVGTNHFGNTEINSDLSAEEMLAYVALYKSLITMNPEEENPDADDEEMQLNITPQDIMDFFEKTEYIPITTEVTHDNPCTGMNCKRRMIQTDSGYFWEYYCDGDHDNLTGEIGACHVADELLEKIIDLTGAEENGIDTEQAQEIIDSYIDMFKKELDIDEGDFRKFGAADNSKAQEFYQKLIDGELSGADIWQIDTPIGEEGASEET
ncbi:hypothetical protein [Huintestinicola sp.]